MFQGKANAPRANQQKKWRKSTIQLVPTTAVLPTTENIELPKKVKSSAAENDLKAAKKPNMSISESNIPLRLPRAKQSTSSDSSNLLKERNSEHGEEPILQDLGESAPARRSPFRKPKKSVEKENFGH